MTSPSLEEAKRGYLSAMWEQVPQLNNVDWRRAASCWRLASAYAIKSYMSTFNVCMWKYVYHKDKCVPLLLWKWGCRMTCSFCPVVFSWSKSCLVGEVCCWVSALLRWPTFLCSGGPSRQHLNSRATQRVSLLLQEVWKIHMRPVSLLLKSPLVVQKGGAKVPPLMLSHPQGTQTCPRRFHRQLFWVPTLSMCVLISAWSLMVTRHLWVFLVMTLYMSQIQGTMENTNGAAPWWTRAQPSICRQDPCPTTTGMSVRLWRDFALLLF